MTVSLLSADIWNVVYMFEKWRYNIRKCKLKKIKQKVEEKRAKISAGFEAFKAKFAKA